MNAVFLFVARRLRWLIGVPLFPQLFDSLLLAWTFFTCRPRLAALEALQEALETRVALAVHRFGGLEFRDARDRELGHVHGHGLLDVHVGCAPARTLIGEGRVRPHHIFPKSGWVSFQMDTPADVPFALTLLGIAEARNGDPQRPSPARLRFSRARIAGG
jgi:hypothetical protein